MVTFKFKRAKFDLHMLAQYVGLFATCFPGNSKLTVEYLQWLYANNPHGRAIGYDAFSEGRLVAHYVTVPVMFAVPDGSDLKGCWSLNTATHPEFQGKGLFVQLAEKTYEDAAIEGCSFIVGVANQYSSHGFIRRLGFSNLGHLVTQFGYSKTQAKEEQRGWGRRWNSSTLRWRLKNPSARYDVRRRGDSAVVSTHVLHEMINVDLGNFPVSYFDTVERQVLKDIFPSIQIAFGNTSKGLLVRVPQRLLPSPWNVIFRRLGAEQLVPPAELQIVGLDLDTF
jgi:GNAT superfamily N-acetyltransferase